jgi:hypothetical protein
MAALLMICSKEEQKAVVWFLWAEGVKGVEIHKHLSAQYVNNVLPQHSVYEWIEVFTNGWTNVTDSEHSGCLPISSSNDKQQ